jgi:FtsP/CotA-like multicopper oxidase with cupredoxin domain
MKTIAAPDSARRLLWTLCLAAVASLAQPAARAQSPDPADQVCPRFAPGSVLPAPADLYSQNGALEVTLRLQTVTDAQGLTRYCYVTAGGALAPTLHLWPGDQLTLHLLNALPAPSPPSAPGAPGGDCVANTMGPATTNLHFHGMNLPPTCHQDDVVSVLVQPQGSFDYIVQIPSDEPPGLYWYHPHPHGFSEAQVLGGAAGAIIVEGIENLVPEVAGLPQRVWVLRDQQRAAPWGGSAGEPGFDLSVNFVPVTYPAYATPVLQSSSSAREFWRVLNASADEILDIQYLISGVPQPLAIIGIDGVPVGQSAGAIQTLTDTHFLLPAGARVEFIVTTPPVGAAGQLVTRQVDAGNGALPYPARPLALISSTGTAQGAPAIRRRLKASFRRTRFANLAAASPDAQRRLFFSEGEVSPGHAAYFITLEGHTPKVYDMSAPPDLVVHEGTVEDWTVENRSGEDHVFHIHQLHFQVQAINGVAVVDPALRDTVNVPHWPGAGPYPSVTLRMDFRDPAIVGTFVYHCHLLAHEDAGMMGGLQLLPNGIATATALSASRASINVNAPVTLIATVTPAVTGTAVNGTLQFIVDGVPLGGSQPVSGGQATFTTSFSSRGAHTLTAAYSGDADCNESLSSDLALSIEDFSLSAPAISLTAGASGVSTVMLLGTSGFDSAVTLTCALLDSFPGAHCDLTPASFTGSGSAQLHVSTAAAPAAMNTIGAATLAGLGLVVACVRNRGTRREGRYPGARLVWLLLSLLALGCSGSSRTAVGTPPGAYQVLVTATAVQGSSQLQHRLTVPIEVH